MKSMRDPENTVQMAVEITARSLGRVNYERSRWGRAGSLASTQLHRGGEGQNKNKDFTRGIASFQRHCESLTTLSHLLIEVYFPEMLSTLKRSNECPEGEETRRNRKKTRVVGILHASIKVW